MAVATAPENPPRARVRAVVAAVPMSVATVMVVAVATAPVNPPRARVRAVVAAVPTSVATIMVVAVTVAVFTLMPRAVAMATGNPLHHLDHDQGIVTFSDTIQGSLSRFYLPPTCYAPTPSLLITLALSSFLSLRFSPSFPPSLSFSLPLSVFLSPSVFLFRSLFVQVF